MTTRPTIHLTNWASRSQHGPGRKICAMRLPRRWEHGDGRCHLAAPPQYLFDAWRRGDLSGEEYLREFGELFTETTKAAFRPGRLHWWPTGAETPALVKDGDTLLCACKRKDRRGPDDHECHLEWLAPVLHELGWKVILYGQEWRPGDGTPQQELF